MSPLGMMAAQPTAAPATSATKNSFLRSPSGEKSPSAAHCRTRSRSYPQCLFEAIAISRRRSPSRRRGGRILASPEPASRPSLIPFPPGCGARSQSRSVGLPLSKDIFKSVEWDATTAKERHVYDMKKTSAQKVESPSQLTDARIKELGDWRGK